MFGANNLVEEFRKEVDDQGRGALIEAYVNEPSADAMAEKALELLVEELDAIDKS